ncbi:hypothetical protein GCM10022419_128310 [Nonomuraea rosea]|uniref:ABC transporter ATP-binding protein n=1 Tax=Nonomuraea rosea TaxID=638574 RepID=A0ABP6ZX17_9ACTN
MRPLDPGTAPHNTSVLRLLRPGRGLAAALAAAGAAATALPLAAPQLTRRFVDDAIGGASTRHLTLIALAYLGLAVAGQAARMVTAWLASRLAWDGTNRLRERLAGHALGLDLDYHGRHTPGELIERVDGDVVAVADFVVAFLLDVVAGALLLAGVVVIVFGVDRRIGCALLAYCLLIGFGMTRAQRLAVPSAARARAAGAALMGAHSWCRTGRAYASQVPRLFSETLRENLLLGEIATDAEIARALELAAFEQDLAAMPDGLGTVVGPRGVRLSGGQVQRATAARALVRDPDLLVVDDLSSALDVETERLLWDRIAGRGPATVLVVSHRQAALERADQVIVLDRGRVAGRGPLGELLESCAEMRRLWSAELIAEAGEQAGG